MSKWKPLERGVLPGSSPYAMVDKYARENPAEEVWINDKYQVNVRRGIETGSMLGTMVHLSIKLRLTKGWYMDWREMQLIKNQLVGPENEGVELYPAESRLVDGSNQFHIWVFEDEKVRLPFGFGERLVTESQDIGNVQRKFDIKPADLEEMEQKWLKMKSEYENDN